MSHIEHHNPCYTNVVIADNPQTCYCRCNLFSVILSVSMNISCSLVKGFNFKIPEQPRKSFRRLITKQAKNVNQTVNTK
jgi:hypothetical protein